MAILTRVTGNTVAPVHPPFKLLAKLILAGDIKSQLVPLPQLTVLLSIPLSPGEKGEALR